MSEAEAKHKFDGVSKAIQRALLRGERHSIKSFENMLMDRYGVDPNHTNTRINDAIRSLAKMDIIVLKEWVGKKPSHLEWYLPTKGNWARDLVAARKKLGISR